MNKSLSKMFSVITILALMLVALPMQSAQAAPTELFFSEYIEGTSNNKALEIYNGTGGTVNLSTGGYSIQMFFNGSASAGLTINLTGSVVTGDVYVIAQSSASAPILAQADQTNGAGWFNGDDAVVLRKGTTVIDVIGQIGFDPGSEWGTGLISTADNTLQRKSSIEAGDPNGADAFDPSVEWDGFPTDTFSGLGCHLDCPPAVASTIPTNGAINVFTGSNINISFNEAVTVTGSWYSISCVNSGAHTATVSGGPTTFTLNPDTDFANTENCTITVFASNVTDQDGTPDNMASNYTFSFTTEAPPPPAVPIHDIQGASHLSSLTSTGNTPGIVTAKTSNGFWMEAPQADWDTNDATSEGIFVFTSSAPSVNIGDSVRVSGNISEFRPGGASSNNLTTTEITSPSVAILTSGNLPPTPVIIGTGGRVPPDVIIEDDASGSVETSGVFDPAMDGIDFYESLEGMLVQVNNPVVVGPRNNFGEIFVLGDDGANAGVRTARDGIVIQPNDFNPERIQLDDTLAATPLLAKVGDHFTGPAVGVLNYDFGNFEVLITSAMTLSPGSLTREVTGNPTQHQLSVASFNVENLSPSDPQSKFDTLANLIAVNLKSPDIIGLEEIQDNTGPTNDGTVDANLTLDKLVAAIVSAGGPEYEYRQINPVNNEDGGQPGGNIRVGFLFNPDRVTFVDRPGGTSTDAVGVVSGASGPELTFSPGRVDPTDPAFTDSRKPLAGEFLFKGDKVFIVVNHFTSKSGDQPLFGRFQPPTLSSEAQRLQQAQVVNDFVDSIFALDSDANVIVLGDLNDFQFSPVLNTLKGGVLVDLVETLPLNEQYTYVFEGNSQVLDHILSSNRLADVPFSYDVVHVNSEFADQASDHEPEVALMCVDRTAPSLTVTVSPTSLWPPNHKYVTVNATVTFSDNADPNAVLGSVSITSNEPDNAPGPEDGNTTDDIVIVDNDTFNLRAERSDIGTGRIYTITYQVTDACGNTATQSATVTVPLQLGN